ncbi:MAG: DNA polymerase III subunit alpha, partial [Nitrospirae bacterium]|nr:DNA polymerase III subunit alpha [Nitrospirota bacterium]
MHHSGFVHLHLHTQYSLLDGANRLGDIIKKAKEFGMPALAITDHGNMFGAIEFYQKAEKAGIKPIIGCEMYVARGSRFDKTPGGAGEAAYHLVLLARNMDGYRNLMKLVSIGYTEGFYYKPRIDRDVLAQYSGGLIGLSACLKGEVPHRLLSGDKSGAVEAALHYKHIFGPENFYLEIQDNGLEEQKTVNTLLVELGEELHIPLVATSDCHYFRKEDAKAHEALLCIQTGKTMSDASRMRFTTEEFYFKSPDEMRSAFEFHPEAIANTIKVAERCNLTLKFDEYHLPHYEVPAGFTKESYLEKLAREGLERRITEYEASLKRDLDVSFKGAEAEKTVAATIDPIPYKLRLETELKIIESMGFAGYFLIVWDFINYAKENGIPVGPGRGSAAGSLVAYALRITDINPLPYGLLFERFLNPERISMPDIDIDFCMDRRDEVIRYVREKYGEDHVSQIITFGTMLAKGVIRDVGRVLDMPYGEVDKVAKLVPDTLKITLAESVAQEPRLKELIDTDPGVKGLFETATALEGLTRHASKHAAGVVISEEPLTHYAPLYKDTNGDIVTQYAKDEIEKIGLVKFDFLGLRTLTVIDNAVKIINSHRAEGEEPFDIRLLPISDPRTYEIIAAGDNSGLFQLESSGMRDIIMRMKPNCLEDLIALVALYRPGPLKSGMVDDFIKRKRGLTPIAYDLPQLAGMLKETYGVILYQEQVMQIAVELAGFTMGQADTLRKAMGKKQPEVMEKQKAIFMKGAVERGINEKTPEGIFDLIAKFAEYGFNKS